MRLYDGISIVAEADTISYDESLRGWRAGERVITDPDKKLELRSHLVSPLQFKLCFTSEERLAIRAALESDPVISDWFEIIEDPRLTQVDLSLQSTKDGIAYLVSKGILTEDRAAEILAGKVI